MSDELKRELQRVAPADELEAQRRAWAVVRGAFEEREPVAWHRRNLRPLVIAAAALVALLLAVLSPPGRALVGEVRDAVEEKPPPTPKPVLAALPTRGLLLVNSPRGPWVVRPDGSRRLLGRYWEGSWSPNALHVVVTRGREISAVRPNGVIRWTIGRPRRISGARWSPGDGFRVVYLSGTELRVVGGDGEGDKVLRNRVAPTPPAWRPNATHELVFGTVDAQVALMNADTGVTRWRAPLDEPAKQFAWSEDGQRLLALGDRYLKIFDATGTELATLGLPVGPSGVAFLRKSHRFVLMRWQPATGRSELVLMQAEAERGEERSLFSAAGEFGPLAVSPNGRWLLVGWVGADQWLFLRLDALRVTAVSNIAEQFGGPRRDKPLSAHFPASVSWCCPASP